MLVPDHLGEVELAATVASAATVAAQGSSVLIDRAVDSSAGGGTQVVGADEVRQGDELMLDALSLKVDRHGNEQVEIKVGMRAAALFEHKARLETSLVVPRSLGTLSRGLFMDQLWLLTRLGLKDADMTLLNVLQRWTEWEGVLCDLLERGLLATGSQRRRRRDLEALSDDDDDLDDPFDRMAMESTDSGGSLGEQDDEMQSMASTSSATRHMGDFEQMLRVIGCVLKSSIRDDLKACTKGDVGGGSETAAAVYLHQLDVLVHKVDELRSTVLQRMAQLHSEDDTAARVVDKLEEFVLMNIQQCSARLALLFGPDRDADLHARACQLGLGVFHVLRDRGYQGGVEGTGSRAASEMYLLRWHNLKHYFLAAMYLNVQQHKPSMLWTDFVGMFAAAVAMATSLLIFWVAERGMRRFTVELLVALVLGYVLKDRLKEWGKRYFVPLINYPHRMGRLRLVSLGKTTPKDVVGNVNEWFFTKERANSSQVEYNLRRHSHQPRVAESEANPLTRGRLDRREAGPENSLTYAREFWLEEPEWRKCTEMSLSGVSTSDDVHLLQTIRVNLIEFCKRIPKHDENYAVVDPSTGLPTSMECPEIHKLRLKIQVSCKKRESRPRTWAQKLFGCCCGRFFGRARVAGDNRRRHIIVDDRFYVLLDSNGIRKLDKR